MKSVFAYPRVCEAPYCEHPAIAGPLCEHHANETWKALWSEENEGLTVGQLRKKLEEEWKVEN